MTRITFSIRARLTLFIMAFVAIVVGVAVSGVLAVKSVDLKTKEIDQKWLAATAMLAEMADRISEYRIAEGYRALAQGPKGRAEADLLADGHRREIQNLQNKYTALVSNRVQRADLESFRIAWKAYYTEHDAWVQAETAGTLAGPARYEQSLQQHYKVADDAVDRLIAENESAAHTQAKAADQLTGQATGIAIAVSAVSILLAMWLLTRIRSQITYPLEAITQALSKLAAGSRDIRVPEVHRADEIGAMAKAFEIFRTNALALEQAHEATRVAQEQAHTLARHDALTGLPNRRVLSAELQEVLSRAQKGTSPHWVLLVGLDHFKQVNDLQGHQVGDLVLCEVARRLKEIVASNGMVARLGGDEFAIISTSCAEQQASMEGAQHLASRVLGVIRLPILVGERSVEIGASIGIAACQADGTDAGSLLHAADIAMYRAKRDGRGTFRFFEQSMDDDLRAKGSLEADLKRAVSEEHIKPYYQPLVEIRNNRICGFEVLARWQHPGRGFVPPDLFIPVVEQLGLMTDLTSSVLRQACRDAKHWPEDIRLAVNISPSELKDPLLPSRLFAILTQEGFAPARLEVEITETALVSNIATAKSILTTLQSSGIKVCLDDFGTGYSSLYHLRELKFDKVKIDRSFVQSMRNNPESEKIVDAILGLTKNLNLPTVAEGIEDLSVLLRLAAKGCEFGQGYYFGKAMPADSAIDLLTERTIIQKRITEAQQAA
jgi:diguanylate cyclase (GGDEF)-like protein